MLKYLVKGIITALCIIIVFAGKIAAQPSKHYSPLSIDTLDPAGIKYFAEYFKKEKDTISVADAKTKKFIVEQCSLRCDMFRKFVTSGELLTYTYGDSLLRKVANNIINSNPVLKGKVNVYLSRSLVPNAFSAGNSLVVVNIGLLSRLANESQLAFILCHEFSHQMLSHGNNAIYTNAIKYNDKEFQRKIKTALAEEYNVTVSLEKLLLPGLMADMAYSRAEELAADSMGLQYLMNTNYDLLASLSTMDVLDKLDDEAKNDSLNLKKFFSIPQVPAKPSWYEFEENSLGVFETEIDTLKDTLRTHPDCGLRKAILSKKLDGRTKLGTDPHSAEFQDLRLIARSESIQMMYDRGNLGNSMYLALHQLEERPEDVYNRAMVALCMARLAKHKKERTAGKYINIPDPDFGDSYNHFLHLINELSPQEAATFSYYMVNPVSPELKSNEAYLASLTFAAYVNGKTEEFNQLYKEYNGKFSNGKFSKTLAVLAPKK